MADREQSRDAIYRRPVVVAVAHQDRADGHPDAHVGEEVVVGVRLSQPEANAGRGHHVVDDKHGLVADHLDDAAPE